jgi:ATP-dependent DNA helicase RecQ
MEQEIIKENLQELKAWQIIDYTAENDAPYIILKKNRVAIEGLTINLQLYKKRREAFIVRAKKMIEYAEAGECRSIFVNRYFGDNSTKSCGICDNCLKAKATNLSTEEFEKIRNSIQNALSANSLASAVLLEKLAGVNKEKFLSVVNFLQAEQKLYVNEKGEIAIKR